LQLPISYLTEGGKMEWLSEQCWKNREWEKLLRKLPAEMWLKDLENFLVKYGVDDGFE
jgi:hypothetical protein